MAHWSTLPIALRWHDRYAYALWHFKLNSFMRRMKWRWFCPCGQLGASWPQTGCCNNRPYFSQCCRPQSLRLRCRKTKCLARACLLAFRSPHMVESREGKKALLTLSTKGHKSHSWGLHSYDPLTCPPRYAIMEKMRISAHWSWGTPTLFRTHCITDTGRGGTSAPWHRRCSFTGSLPSQRNIFGS